MQSCVKKSFMPHLIAGSTMKISWSVPEIQVVEGLQTIENKGNFSFLFGYISKSNFVSE